MSGRESFRALRGDTCKVLRSFAMFCEVCDRVYAFGGLRLHDGGRGEDLYGALKDGVGAHAHAKGVLRAQWNIHLRARDSDSDDGQSANS
eukprot:2143216-Pleurochrysis_carterae.AAC.3